MSAHVSGTTEVYFTVDGIAKHRHDGVTGWHSVHIKHAGAFHDSAATPVGDMTKAQSKVYELALAGKSYEYLWAPRSRHEEVRVRAKKVVMTEAVKEEFAAAGFTAA